MDQGQELRHLRADWPMASDERRGQGSAEPEDVARRERPSLPERFNRDDGLRGQVSRLLSFAVHEPASGRYHLDGYSPRRRPRAEAERVPEGRRYHGAWNRGTWRTAPEGRPGLGAAFFNALGRAARSDAAAINSPFRRTGRHPNPHRRRSTPWPSVPA